MSPAREWLEVDRQGLAKLLERRGKLALLCELIGNAWDADGVSRVEVVIEPEVGSPTATIVVRDDAPGGFADMSHAWTLFAESSRKSTPEKRGRFNLGEKLVLATCREAAIVSTRSAVTFDARGRTLSRARRERGTEFTGIVRATRAELAELDAAVRRLISPPGVVTVVNGDPLLERAPVRVAEATLATELSDEGGVLRRTKRKTSVEFFEPLPGEDAYLYELGVPVVEIDLPWHANVRQKVPLNMERDNVTPSYLRAIQVLAANHLRDQLSEADAGSTFLSEALADDDVAPETVTRALDLRFGEQRAIWDPSDPEANMTLTARGFTLIRGSQLTKAQWANVRRHDGDRTRPAGQVAPTKKTQFSPDGVDRWVPRARWTPAVTAVVDYAAVICRELLGCQVDVRVLSDVTENYAACFGDLGAGRPSLVLNLGRLGHAWFDAALDGPGRPTLALNELLLHELGHHVEGNHLSERYHGALCELGAKMVGLALAKPELFTGSGPGLEKKSVA